MVSAGEAPRAREHAPLAGKRIVLGVAGSSAAYRSIDLARELVRRGATVDVILTPSAAGLVTPRIFEWATGRRAVVEASGRAEHIEYAASADAMVVAPATLNTLAKIAWGIGDTLVALTAIAFLGSGKPLILAPAMNLRLYRSPQYARVERALREMGATIIPPLVEEGKAKYPPLRDLAHIIESITLRGRDLEGTRALVTAGPTREHIDPVRVITNPSSGLMGVLVALELASRGADVTLVHGPLSTSPPYMVRRVRVETAGEMAEAVERLTSRTVFDIAVFAAAPADYRVPQPSREKIPSRRGALELRLEPTRKTIASVARRPRILIGFAAETVSTREELVEKARSKLAEYGLDMVVANIVGVPGRGFESGFIDACFIDAGGSIECPGYISKAEAARRIADWVAERIGGRG